MSGFNKGDTVRFADNEFTVSYVSMGGNVELRSKSGTTLSDYHKPETLRLVKPAVPAAPTAGTVIEYYGNRYIVNKDAKLHAIDYYTGKPDAHANAGEWKNLWHPDVKVIG